MRGRLRDPGRLPDRGQAHPLFPQQPDDLRRPAVPPVPRFPQRSQFREQRYYRFRHRASPSGPCPELLPRSEVERLPIQYLGTVDRSRMGGVDTQQIEQVPRRRLDLDAYRWPCYLTAAAVALAGGGWLSHLAGPLSAFDDVRALLRGEGAPITVPQFPPDVPATTLVVTIPPPPPETVVREVPVLLPYITEDTTSANPTTAAGPATPGSGGARPGAGADPTDPPARTAQPPTSPATRDPAPTATPGPGPSSSSGPVPLPSDGPGPTGDPGAGGGGDGAPGAGVDPEGGSGDASGAAPPAPAGQPAGDEVGPPGAAPLARP